jgi:hypothetical protein
MADEPEKNKTGFIAEVVSCLESGQASFSCSYENLTRID